MFIYQQCSNLLIQLEQDLKQLELWSEQTPTIEQLSSVQPFAVDTLAFEQWLQFIFIPKMSYLVNAQTALPKNMAILPMAEESFKHQQVTPLLTTITQLDQLISADLPK
ncbi:hypothetical protein GCM10008107_27720 [Psychrosphaera saromensis]|uniref:YqcC-like domain-containing protein n=1 Tax=Psychrosphaera saromensis TaxID=716813 RepID=A0A2S7UVV3_9GAMM|nr:YqcC family protein [Psychrosphaera saromensis]PQJ54077.1 hypothetical protein BTO11_10720 [Psychrosphaera saromensis]GHB76640.1 hypothetical protein GCM10008107_27720 [Psychrosphaera saromensis]GLQ14425.1 hypothetical protein GCM10007917_18800 [Psychrosphaera saromensis]